MNGIIVIAILIAMHGVIAYYRDEVSIFVSRAKIKILDIWIKILSGKK